MGGQGVGMSKGGCPRSPPGGEKIIIVYASPTDASCVLLAHNHQKLSSRRGERALRALDQHGSLQLASTRATAIALSETIEQRGHANQMSRSARATGPGLRCSIVRGARSRSTKPAVDQEGQGVAKMLPARLFDSRARGPHRVRYFLFFYFWVRYFLFFFCFVLGVWTPRIIIKFWLILR